MINEIDKQFLKEAIELSKQCPKSQTSYAVGAVIVKGDQVIATGYSLELGEGTHAEEVALRKTQQSLEGCTLYSSLEPCSIRKSGRTSCTSRILKTELRRIVYALQEPSVFVDCEGTSVLRENGLEVIIVPEYADLVRQVNQHILA